MLLVYTAEAHASDEWPVGPHIHQPQPKSTAGRCAVATRRLAQLGLESLPALVETSSEAFHRAYASWPLRWYFMRDRRIEHIAQPHDGGGYAPEEIVTWLCARRYDALQPAVLT